VELAEVLPVDAQLLDSVMQRRWPPWPMADVVAVALCCHPSALWPEWFRLGSGSPREPGRLAQQITSTEGT
jgi:lambda repressor-like predicted transcriptional regulator